ncbi:hypothetical protein M378DRAFT_107865 [Amanita muscaria Koide BX008]|uniref:Uncharacterized protein n=1 Tax=Amanita muscaria (strain Koide BX008) TaxID=946122 RepID=A0A0C2X2E7_AMAMK|nr:hypothetical protein M378DRAFT_107865 [Amanita muscaria Koide BX008]
MPVLPGSINAKYAILILIVFFTSAVANTDFQDCFQRLQQGALGLQGAVDFSGNPVTSAEQAAGLTYQACINACGPRSEPFDWVVFSQKFTGWVLPYLALISQLPYGASDRLSNFEAIIMSVGSPMLAAYSLILAVTSNRWMVRRLRGRSTHHNAYFAAVVLGGLQQVSLRLAGDKTSLVMLKKNDNFWRILARGLEYSTTRWNLPAIFSMLIVAISYIFTWIDTVRCTLNNEGTCSGGSVGSLWMSLLPIVLCNLQLSPKTDLTRILKTFTYAQKQFPVATDGFAQPLDIKAYPDLVDEDIVCSSPLCYYARIFHWFKVAREIADAFEGSLPEMDNQLPPMSPMTNVEAEHCELLRDHATRKHDERWDLILIIARSVILAVFLLWGTIGAAIFSNYLTPTIGLGCWSGSYLLYATLATFVWFLAFVSSIFAYIYSTSKASRSSLMRLFGALAIILRMAAKIIAGLNAAWVFVFTILQFTNTYNTCYCNSSVLGLGTKAYAILSFSSAQMTTVISYWTEGMLMALGTAFLFIAAFNVLKQSPDMPLNALGQLEDQENKYE